MLDADNILLYPKVPAPNQKPKFREKYELQPYPSSLVIHVFILFAPRTILEAIKL
jgi:hypothetical protein